MVSSSIITCLLVFGVVFTIGAIIALIVLIASKTIKGTTAWAGVLTILIAVVAVAIVSAIAGVIVGAEAIQSIPVLCVIQVIAAIIQTAALTIAVNSVLKNKTLNGAVSFATGINLFMLFVQGISFFSNYSLATQINSGKFDQTYSPLIAQGAIDQETVLELKRTILELTLPDLLLNVVAVVASLAILYAVSILIMRGSTNKKVFPDFAISCVIMIVSSVISVIFADKILIMTIGDTIIAIAAIAYAVSVRGKIQLPKPLKVEDDSFMQTVASVQNEGNAEEKTEQEFNPYE